jgi:hypothetical protein
MFNLLLNNIITHICRGRRTGTVIEAVSDGEERTGYMRYGLMIFAFLGLLLISGVSFAQVDKLTTALDRTDQVIEKAKEVVGKSNSERAKYLLEVAIRLQERAISLKKQSERYDNVAQAVQAGKYTFSAREKALRAIAIARQATENEDYIRRRLERTDDLIRRIEEKAGPDRPDKIMLILDTARKKQQRAMELFRNRRFKMALQLTMQAEKSLEKMIEQVGGYVKTRKRFESLQERYYTLLDRIETDGFGDDAKTRTLIERAESLCAEAGRLADNGAVARAEKTMQKAVEILLRIAENQKEPGKIIRALEHLKRHADILKEKIDASGHRQAGKLHQSAVEHLEKASALYQEGNYKSAATQLQAARQNLARVAKLLEK